MTPKNKSEGFQVEIVQFWWRSWLRKTIVGFLGSKVPTIIRLVLVQFTELPKASSKGFVHAPSRRRTIIGFFFPLQIHLTPKPTIIRLLTPKTLQSMPPKSHNLPWRSHVLLFGAKLPKTYEYSTFDRKKTNAAMFFLELAMQQNPTISPWKPYDLFSDQYSQIATNIRHTTMIGLLRYFDEFLCTFWNKKESNLQKEKKREQTFKKRKKDKEK